MKKKVFSLMMTLVLGFMGLTQAMAQADFPMVFDFEDNTVPATWVNDSVHPWVVYKFTAPDTDYPGYSGSYYLKSGNAGVNSSTSAIEATVEFPSFGKVSFLGGCYGESSSFGTIYDKCQFYIDGEVQFTYGANGSWDAYEYFVEAGTHTFKWEFTKDSFDAGTGDFFGIDDVKFEVVDACADLPTNSYFKYNVSQQIFTADQLGDLGNLGSVKFFNAGDELTRKLDVYVTTTDKETFESETDWVAVDTTDLVFSGDVTFGSSAWTTINFNAPLMIEEGLNVVVTVDDNTDIAIAGLNFTMDTVDAGGNVALYYHSDDTLRINPDPTDLGNIAGTLLGKRNEVQFGEFELTIHDGTETNGYVPMYGGYFDAQTQSECVFPASDLEVLVGKQITGVTFYPASIGYYGSGWGGTRQQVFVKEVESAQLTAYSGLTNATIVFEGTLELPVAGEPYQINFTTPYNYNGGNLLIGVYNIVAGDYKSVNWYGETVAGASAGNNGTTFAQRNFLPKTTFSFGTAQEIDVEPDLYVLEQVNDTTFEMVDTLFFGARPNGYWMRPIDIYSLWNHTGNAINVSRFDFTPEEGFFTAEAIDNELPFQMAIDDTIPMLFTSNVTDTVAFADTTFTRQFVVIYDAARTAGVWPVVMTAYNAVEPDVFELARVVDTFEYRDTLNATADFIYDNYRLPDASIPDGYDAVYKLTIDKDVLLNASVDMGDNGKVALYTEDFYNYGGPDMENYYQGPSFGGGSAFIQGDAFVQKFSNSEMGDWTTIDADAEPENSWADWTADLFYGRDYDLYGDANDGAASSMSYDVYEEYFYGSGTAYTPDNYLVSPKVTIGSIANFSFWASTYYGSPYDAEHFGVFVSTAGNTNPADFTMVNEWTYTERGNMNGERVSNWSPAGNNRFKMNRGGYQQYTVDLSAYAGQEVYIAIRHFNCTDMGALIVDDITLSNGMTRIGGYEYTATPVIKDLPVTAGTYYLVASSTSEDFSVVIDTTAMPCPQVAEAVYPLDDADDIQIGSGIELKWKLDDYATEYMLLFGSTYYCEDTLVDWTTDLAESFLVLPSYPLYHNTNYFWKVCQRNSSCGTGTDGEVWGFTTTFNAPTNLHATDTSIFEGDDVVMEWTAIEDRTFRSYNVYLNDELIGSTTTTPNPHSYTSYTIPANLLTYNMNPGHKVEVTAYYDEGESPKSEPYYIKVSGYGKITGKVFEQDGTTGIKNARVYITGVNEFGEPVEMDTVTTSNNGRYTINRVPVSGDSISYQAFAEKEGYQSPVEPIEGNPRPVAYRGTTQANFILDEVFAPVPPCAVFAEFYPDPEVEDEYVKVTWTMNGGESVNIDFETNDFSQGTFNNTVSSYPWVITTDNVHTGTYAMKSSNAGVAGSTSAIEATVTLSYDGSVSFWALCQGEGTSTVWDKCIFKIDNVEKFSYGASVTGWNEYTYDLTAGTHTLRWEYTKDSSVDPTGDAMWVDDIHFGSAPGREVAEDRSFQYYRIYRTSCYNDGPYNSDNTVLLGNNDTPADLEFVDVNWKTVGPGVYKWGVSRVYEGNREDYPNGRESEISWTCECIDKDMYLNNVRVTVLLNSADSPEGTTVSFTNLNEVEEQNHPMGTITLDETGYYKFGADNPFRKGDYVVTVEHEGYISETDTVSIWSNKHLRYVLTEIIYGTRDAYVSRTGWAMWDDALTGGNVPGGGGGSGELTVNDGTDYNAYLPYYGLYADAEQTTEFVIPAAELSAMTGSPINSMKFYVKGTALSAVSGPFQVYLTEVASTTMSAVSGPAAGTVVYTGALDATGEEMTVNFTTPYNYNGGNLLVGVYTAGGGSYASSTFYGVDQTVTTGICQFDMYGSVQTREVKFLPKTTFSYGNRALASGDQNGNRVANAADNTRHLEGYKVMCTNSFGEPIFNENTPHKFCQVATDRLVEGQKYFFQVAAIYSTGMSPYCDPVEWEYESCENYQDIAIEGEVTPAGNVISWLGGQPGPNPPTPGDEFTFGFEEELAPNGWTIQQHNTTTTWERSQTTGFGAAPHEGEWQMWLHWDYGDQDEWLITPEFAVPANGNLTFWHYGQEGSTHDDHYYVKISTDGGSTWTQLWDASAQPANENHYSTAVNLSLNAYAGQNAKLAWQGYAVGGLWYAWCVDDITVSDGRNAISFDGQKWYRKPVKVVYANTPTQFSKAGAKGENYTIFSNVAANNSDGVAQTSGNREEWLTYMPATFESSEVGIVGAGQGTPFGWAMMIPASQLTQYVGKSVTKVSSYSVDESNFSATQHGEVTAKIYLGGDTQPAGDVLATVTYNVPSTEATWIDADLSNPVAIDGTQNLWVVFESQAVTCSHAAPSYNDIAGTVNARWTYYNGSWSDLANLGVSGKMWAVRAAVEEGTGPVPPQPTPEGVIGYMLFRDGEWLAELPVDVTSYLDAEGGAHDYTMRVIYGGEAVLPSNNYNYAMSCGSTIELGYDVVCAPGDPISGAYYYESANDFGAVISWEPQPEPPTPPTPPTAEATIILTAGDVWGDGTGYQMLLDADATAFGNEIPATGPYTLNNYDAFEYLIPVNADCNTYTSNIVFNNSIAITVPAGTYDWCITNPEPGGNMWIASDNGTAGGRKDNYVFEAGMTYEFVPAMFGQNDGVDVTITPTGTKNRAALTGYNIYRSTTNSNYQLIGTAPADATEYRDNVAAGHYFYQVTAVYDNDCESAPAANADDASLNYVEVEVTSVDDNTNRVALYPNPTNGLVKIEANGMRHITVVNALGQVVFDNDITGDEYQINMAQFNAGVYVVRIATENGVSTQRVTVVR